MSRAVRIKAPPMLTYAGQKKILARADLCPFCECDFLYFAYGSVVCDACQAEGPFAGEQFGDKPETYIMAVKLWNKRRPAE